MNSQTKSFLQALKKEGVRRHIPNISEYTAKFLQGLIRFKKPRCILEIGTANGYSTLSMASALQKNGSGKIVSYEISEVAHLEAVKNTKKMGLENFVILRLGDVLEKTPREKFNLIFIDGHKRKYAEFFALAKKVLQPNGLIVVDDVIKFREKTKSFYAMLEKNKNWERIIIPVDGDDGVMLLWQSQ